MQGAGTPHHLRALDVLSGQPLDDVPLSDDEETIRRPERDQNRYEEDRREKGESWGDDASVYSESAEEQYPYPEASPKTAYRETMYPQSIIDMPAFPNPHYNPSPALRLSFWDRLRGRGKPHVSWTKSLLRIARSSWLNVLLAVVPVAWGLHTVHNISHTVQFAVCFVALIPLCKLFDYGGKTLALYCGKDIGDLIIVTMNNTVEAIIAICLLARCQLRLLQSTIVGVVLLRLLLVPACAFIAGGARVAAQSLRPHHTELNQTLLTTGVLTILLPTAFFAALNGGSPLENGRSAVSDDMRGDILKVSRGLAIMLLAVLVLILLSVASKFMCSYVCSRIFLHNPPRPSALHEHNDAPAESKESVEENEDEEPEINPWACLILLILTLGLSAVTTEFLVESIEPIREWYGIKEEWFGLVLLPFVSFSADGILSFVSYMRRHLQYYLGKPLSPPKTLAEARSIDLSIQFLNLWMPVLVLLAWFCHKPFSLLFDLFEVVLLISATFMVNYVTADAKTNWAEGVMMLALYCMIALTSWFYPGQIGVNKMLSCSSVQEALALDAVPPLNSTSTTNFTNISFAGFHAMVEDGQISNFTDHLRDLKRLYDLLKQIEQGS